MINVLKIINNALANRNKSVNTLWTSESDFLSDESTDILDLIDTSLNMYQCPTTSNDIDTTIKEYLWHISDHATGLQWNIFISDYIDYALHLRLTKANSIVTSSIVNILTLLHSGYFKECINMIEDPSINFEWLDDTTREWLIRILSNADATK